MIVKMSKLSFIFLDSEKDTALDKIRKAGVVHLEQNFFGNSDTLTDFQARRDRVEKAWMRLDHKAAKEDVVYSAEEAETLTDRVHDVLESIRSTEEKLNMIRDDMVWWEPWGDFDPSEVSIMRSKGVNLHFYEILKSEWEELSRDRRAFTVSVNKNTVYGIIAETNGDGVPEHMSVRLPEYGISELRKQQVHAKEKLKGLYEVLQQLGGKRSLLEERMRILDEEIRYQQIRAGLGNEEILDYFTGYAPERENEAIRSLAADNGWALIVTEPEEGDPVPTLVENKKAVRVIQPLFKLMEVLPGYREYDLSLDFLIFFSLFFAMIIGDAGYGMLFLLTTALVHRKMRKANDTIKLLYVLSACTVIWGSLTGTWFGSSALAGWAPLKQLVIPNIASFPELFSGDIDSSDAIKYMCFVIGTFQLSIARIKNFIGRMPSLQALAQLGWLSMLVGVYHIVLFLVLAIGPIPPYALYLIAAGLGAVVMFGEQEKGVNFFKGFLKGLAGLFTTFLDAIGLLSNIISYIRLFAVGLASVAIASSFNEMAGPMMQGPTIIIGIIILILGHGLNIMMGALSLIVHGVRLNMLEFSGHLDMEWSGVKYEPFNKVEAIKN